MNDEEDEDEEESMNEDEEDEDEDEDEEEIIHAIQSSDAHGFELSSFATPWIHGWVLDPRRRRLIVDNSKARLVTVKIDAEEVPVTHEFYILLGQTLEQIGTVRELAFEVEFLVDASYVRIHILGLLACLQKLPYLEKLWVTFGYDEDDDVDGSEGVHAFDAIARYVAASTRLREFSLSLSAHLDSERLASNVWDPICQGIARNRSGLEKVTMECRSDLLSPEAYGRGLQRVLQNPTLRWNPSIGSQGFDLRSGSLDCSLLRLFLDLLIRTQSRMEWFNSHVRLSSNENWDEIVQLFTDNFYITNVDWGYVGFVDVGSNPSEGCQQQQTFSQRIESFTTHVTTILKLNGAGRKSFHDDPQKPRTAGVALLSRVADDLNCIYHVVRAYPALCALPQQTTTTTTSTSTLNQ